MSWCAGLGSVDWLDELDHIAAITTALIAIWAWWQFGVRRGRRRVALERYLKSLQGKPQWHNDQGQRTIVHLMAELRRTEAEVIEGAFASRKIEVIRVPDPMTGFAAKLMLAYRDTDAA
ncbi:hypothetical protein [Sphingomonas sp.]|uniref:hypothetical protein n=1 Tax=Sphingomonas sp. TaxID=28214 RepID=UPI003D6CFC60